MAKKKRFIRRNRFFVIMLLLFSVYIGATLVRQELKMYELAKEEELLAKQKTKLNSEIEDLKKDIQASKSPEYVEKVAREKLKMVKSDEIIYILKKE